MPQRIQDSSYSHTEAPADFLQRSRWPLILQITLGAAIAFAGIALAAEFSHRLGHTGIFYGALAAILGVLSFLIALMAERHRDMVLVAEFQNAMFASAAGLNARFCLITKQDGAVVYFDPGFQRLFSDFKNRDIRHIDELFDNVALPASARRKIYEALEHASNEKVIFSTKGPDGYPVNIVLSMDILQRPRGFFLFRGRDFLERRADIDLLTSASKALTSSGSMLFSNMLHSLPVGVFATNKDGQVVFINKPLLAWLGYSEGDVADSPLALRDLVYQMGDNKIGRVEMTDFIGEATLQKKTGALIKEHFTQQIMRDESNAIIGSTSIVSESMHSPAA